MAALRIYESLVKLLFRTKRVTTIPDSSGGWI
jgi:hypothetical protein